MAGKLESNLKALVWESLPNLKKLNSEGAWHNPPIKSKKRKLPKLTVLHLARFLSRGLPPGLVIIIVVLIVLVTFLVALPGQHSAFGTLNDIHLSGTVYGVSNGDTLRAPFPILKVVGEQSSDTLATILGDLYGDWSHSFVGIDDTNPALPGKIVRHPFSGVGIAACFDLPAEIQQIIATHSKERDLGKRTVESIIVHHADFVSFEPFKR